MPIPALGLTHYPPKITGAAFNAEIGFRRVKFWLADQGRRRIARLGDIVAVSIQPNGYTKLVLRLRKDILVPTSHREAVQLVKALNALLSERQATEQRKHGAKRTKSLLELALEGRT